MRVKVTQPQPDCVVIEQGRSYGLAALGVAGVAAWAGALVALGDTAAGLVWIVVGLVALPTAVLAALRALRTRTRSLVRTTGRLLLDGEPIELARVELRVSKFPVTRVPTGYVLSLWVMSSSGPEDILLGRFPTLLDASTLSGTLEEFVQRASVKQAGLRLR